MQPVPRTKATSWLVAICASFSPFIAWLGSISERQADLGGSLGWDWLSFGEPICSNPCAQMLNEPICPLVCAATIFIELLLVSPIDPIGS